MLQDLMLMPDQIVVGDQIVRDNGWWEVVSVRREGLNSIEFDLVDASGDKMQLRFFPPVDTTMLVRVRPCGSSSRLKERP